MGVAESLGQKMDSWKVNGSVSTVATVGSTAADDAGDERDANIRNINNLALDIASVAKTQSDLIARLRANGQIQDL